MSALQVVPEQLSPSAAIHCRRLQCTLPARACVLRQLVSDRQRTRDTWRGVAGEYPSCVTRTCAQGREVRAAVEAAGALRWRGAGLHGHWSPLRGDVRAQNEARQRLARVGALDPVSSIDCEPFGDTRAVFAADSPAIGSAAEASRIAGGTDP